MKTKSSLLFLLLIVSFACTKQELSPKTNPVSADASIDNASSKTRSELLTGHAWIYKGFYFRYINQSSKGDPQYVRGASGNIIDLDKTIFHFKTDGSFVEVDGGNRYPGTWSFTNSADTVLTMDYTYWKDVATIITFSNSRLNYTQPMGYNAKSYTELIPSVK